MANGTIVLALSMKVKHGDCDPSNPAEYFVRMFWGIRIASIRRLILIEFYYHDFNFIFLSKLFIHIYVNNISTDLRMVNVIYLIAGSRFLWSMSA